MKLTKQVGRACLALTCMAGLCGVGCGGSSSETPWPAEPIDLEPGPAGEDLQRGNVVDTTKLPDNYTKKAKAAAGTETDPDADPTDPTLDPESAPLAPDPEAPESGE